MGRARKDTARSVASLWCKGGHRVECRTPLNYERASALSRWFSHDTAGNSSRFVQEGRHWEAIRNVCERQAHWFAVH